MNEVETGPLRPPPRAGSRAGALRAGAPPGAAAQRRRLLPPGLRRGKRPPRGPLAALHADRADRAAARRAARLRASVPHRRLRARSSSELGSAELTPGDLGWRCGRTRAWRRARSAASSRRLRPLARRVVADPLAAEHGGRLDPDRPGRGRHPVELGEGEELLDAARRSCSRRRPEGDLLLHVARGPRRRLPHFADQIYGLLALSQLARVREDAGRSRPPVARAEDRRVADAERRLALDLRPGGGDGGRALRDLLDPPGLDGDDGPPQPQRGERGPSFRAAALRGLDWI